jgi:diguanylate cyclase (GGDEF)-like protein/PAS domain S-box-containing protein
MISQNRAGTNDQLNDQFHDSPQRSPELPSRNGKYSILIVEDNEEIRRILSWQLTRNEYIVKSVDNGAEALELVQQESFDLLLLDAQMPDMSGLEVLTALRATYPATELPILMVTARSESQDVVDALNRGANDYVTKPIDFPSLLARIQTHLTVKEALRHSEERYAMAARAANDGLWDWNLQTQRIYFSPRWKSMLGCGDSDVGTDPDEWFNRVHHDDIDRLKEEIQAHIEGNTPLLESEHRMLHKDGTYRWVFSRGLVVRDTERRAVRMAGSQTDTTSGKVADPLTGLPNRVLFMDRLIRSIERLKHHPDSLFAVLFLDLDRFKMVNDRFGHGLGDQLLIAIARRLETGLRYSDTVARLGREHILARLGGDEFSILLDPIKDVSEATRVADRILQEFTAPFHLNDQEVYATASVGIALSATGYTRAEDLLRDADIAMYRAKSLGKARCEVFDTAMRDAIAARLQMETDLRGALERQEFLVNFQTIVCLKTGRVSGFEALVRWQHPTRGLVSPGEFIPTAEKAGLIVPIERFVLREACRQVKAWQDQFPMHPPITINVNCSSKQFKQPDLVEEISQILRGTRLDAQSLKLEITESLILDNTESINSLLLQLRVLNIQLGMDDFGTGYSSLNYLRHLPIDFLKIDRSFVSRMESNKEDVEIIHTIVTLAHNLGLSVVAEGVETAEQVTLLKTLECEYGQGYFFSKPINCRQAEQLLAAESARRSEAQPAKSKQEESTSPIAELDNSELKNYRELAEQKAAAQSTTMNSGTIEPEHVSRHWANSKNRWAALLAISTMVLAVSLIILTRRHSTNLNKLEIKSDSHSVTKQEVVAQIDKNLGQTTTPRPMSSSPPKAQTAEELRAVAETLREPRKRQEVNQTGDAILKKDPQNSPARQLKATIQNADKNPKPSPSPPKAQTAEELPAVAETLHEPGKRQEMNQTGDAIKSSVYPVVHNHVMGSCKGSLIIDADSIEYVPQGKSKDGFRFQLRDTISVARGDSLKIRFSTKTYTFKAGSDKTREEQRAQVNAMYQQITQSKARANLGP